MNDPHSVAPYAPAPPGRVSGSDHLRGLLESRLISSHIRGTNVHTLHGAPGASGAAVYDSVVARDLAGAGLDWTVALERLRALTVPGGRIVFDVLSADHVLAFDRVRGGRSPASELRAAPRVRAADLIDACDRAGLCVTSIVPYGLIAGELTQATWFGATLAYGSSWERLLSWVLRDEAFLAATLFLEEAVVGALVPDVAAHFLVVLENRPDPAANSRWLERNAALKSALGRGFYRHDLEPIVGASTWNDWRNGLAHHIAHPPTLIAVFRLLDVADAWGYPIELESLLPAGVANDLRLLAVRKRTDDAMWNLVNALQDDPEIGPLLRPRPDIAPGFEFELLRPLALAVLGLRET